MLNYRLRDPTSTNEHWLVNYSLGKARGQWGTGREEFLIDNLFAVTQGVGPVYADKHLVVTRTENPEGLRFAGEIDVTNSEAVIRSVRMAVSDAGDPHLDVSRLSFCDISGIRGLVEAATTLGEGRRMLLHGLPEQLQTVMRVTGWSGLPTLVLCGCAGEAD